jgi:hypothetical protein
MAVTRPRTGTEIRPIVEADVRRAAEFLHANFKSRTAAADWAAAIDVPWQVESPNMGFMLLDGERVVGAYFAVYSDRVIDGRRERFCNLGAWCVLPEYRFHSLRLLQALLAQDGYHFTDLSPSPAVALLNSRLGFRFLDTSTALVPNLPWPSWPGRSVISSDPALIERTLTGRELELYRDHRAAAVARHLVLLQDDEWCYVVFRKDRRKKLPVFASILYVSHPGLFRAMARPLARHLLVRHGALATLAEHHVVKHRPRPSYRLPKPRPRMFLSPYLEPAQIDYLYSELVCTKW